MIFKIKWNLISPLLPRIATTLIKFMINLRSINNLKGFGKCFCGWSYYFSLVNFVRCSLMNSLNAWLINLVLERPFDVFLPLYISRGTSPRFLSHSEMLRKNGLHIQKKRRTMVRPFKGELDTCSVSRPRLCLFLSYICLLSRVHSYEWKRHSYLPFQ